LTSFTCRRRGCLLCCVAGLG